MKFQVIGDDVFYNGDRVAVLVVGHAAAVVRQEVEDELQLDSGSLERELESLQSDYDDLDSNHCDEREQLESKLNAYAAILGVTP